MSILQLTLFDFVPCIFPDFHLLQYFCNSCVVWKKGIKCIQGEGILSVDFVYNWKLGHTLALLHIWLSKEFDLFSTISLPSDGEWRYHYIPKKVLKIMCLVWQSEWVKLWLSWLPMTSHLANNIYSKDWEMVGFLRCGRWGQKQILCNWDMMCCLWDMGWGWRNSWASII